MNRKVIGFVSVEWSEHLLTVQRTLTSFRIAIFVVCVQWLMMLFLAVSLLLQGEWLWAALQFTISVPSSLFFFYHLFRRQLLAFNRVADVAAGSRKHEREALSLLAAMEVSKIGKRYAVLMRLRDGRLAMFAEMTMSLRFKHEAQARELADILNAFLQQPAETETPGVWPPPRVSGATHG